METEAIDVFFCDEIFGTLNILYMLFFVCVFLWLLLYRCGGHATIFKFKQNSFHVHVFNVYLFATVSFFCPLLSNLFTMYADLGNNKTID